MRTMVTIGDRKVIPTDKILTDLAYQIARMQPVVVRVRARVSLEVSTEIEKAIVELATKMRTNGFDVHVERHIPDGKGRRHNWLRDRELVRGADKVVACFSNSDLHVGGTAHALWSAINCGIHSEAWVMSEGVDPMIYEYNQDDEHESQWNTADH